ncbi:hypothetical protein [Chitinophaga sp. S165]|uniref:hypothetical protein n=1 Tax=Chitinophaga sp. S165 TaxID=2135462 RepID=UPI000D71AE8B|nr:hypothetical protein [Chitinophaga sp. S165]PWV56473.1 hypothetical protein C7475_101989 [Chitinophaga sp. S165]
MLNVSKDLSMSMGTGVMQHVANSLTAVAQKQGKKQSAQLNELNKKQSAMLSYAPDMIVSGHRIYSFHSPLSSEVRFEDEYAIIENESLGIIATGRTQHEAEQLFAMEFDYIFQRYNELSDQQMSERIKAIKSMLNTIVKEVTFK